MLSMRDVRVLLLLLIDVLDAIVFEMICRYDFVGWATVAAVMTLTFLNVMIVDGR